MDTSNSEKINPLKLCKQKALEISIAVNNIKWTFAECTKEKVLTLPCHCWQSLCQILEISERKSRDFFLVRSQIVETGVIDMMMNCLGHYSDHCHKDNNNDQMPSTSTCRKRKASNIKCESQSEVKSSEENGIGFGFGALYSQQIAELKCEEALKVQIGKETHITAMLQVLASFINPQDEIPSNSITLPSRFINILSNSCLATILCTYLRNDSMLDLSKRIYLYRAITLLIRALATCDQLVYLLMTKKDGSIPELLKQINEMTNIYHSLIK
jgi:hypothetical protein